MSTKAIIYIALGFLFIIVILQNAGVVTLRLFFWRIDMSTIILVPILIAIGLIIGFIWGRSKWH